MQDMTHFRCDYSVVTHLHTHTHTHTWTQPYTHTHTYTHTYYFIYIDIQDKLGIVTRKSILHTCGALISQEKDAVETVLKSISAQ